MLLYILLLFGGVLFLINFFQFGKNSKLPPQAPWALPFFGHLLALGDFPCRVLLDWKRKYGPVYMVKFGSFRTIILNDTKSVKEAFKLVPLSNRPPFKQYQDSTEGKGFAFIDYHQGEQRQFMLRNLKIFSENGSYMEKKLNEEVNTFLEELSNDGGKGVMISGLFSRTLINSVWGILMGYSFTKGDPEMQRLCTMVNRITAIPGIIESLGIFNPWFSKLFPNFTGVTSFVKAYKELCTFVEDKTEARKNQRIKDEPQNIIDAFKDRMEKTEDPNSTFDPKKNFLPMSMAEMLVGASGTTSTALEWTILYLARHPEIQKKLQQEIIEVITNSRLPFLSDRPNMPYTEAIISEVFRATAFVPISLPHYTNVEVELLGFKIPKNTLLIQNTWGIHHDPELWDEPEEFKPERFLDENGKYLKSENVVIFGVGKRNCIGEFVARDQLFIFITRIFQRFRVEYSGKVPSIFGKHGMVIHPEPGAEPRF